MKYLQRALMEQKEHQNNSRCQSGEVFLEKGKAQSVHSRDTLIIIPPTMTVQLQLRIIQGIQK